MDRRRTRRVALLIGLVVAAVGVAALLMARSNAGTSEVTGVVVAVDSAGGGLGQVRGFTLRVAGGELLTFGLRALHNPTQFPPGHLAEHQATAAPVRVVYRMEGAERLAIHLEDAPH